MRDLNFSKERFERATFTLTNLSITQSPTAAEMTPAPAPRYTAAELRDARGGDHKFQAICDTAEGILNRPLTDSLLRRHSTLYMTTLHFLPRSSLSCSAISSATEGRCAVAHRARSRVWSDKGLLTAADAQRYLATIDAEQPLRNAFYQIFGIVGENQLCGIDHHCTLYGKGLPSEYRRVAWQ